MNRFFALTSVLLALIAGNAAGQARFGIDNSDLYDIAGEFAFVRVQYDSYYDGGWYGGLSLSPREVENLREYLLRGGFLLIDDFRGERQWDAFYRDFSLLFPNRKLVELPPMGMMRTSCTISTRIIR